MGRDHQSVMQKKIRVLFIYLTDTQFIPDNFPSPSTERRDRPQIRTRRKTFGSLNADDGKYCH